MAHEIGHNLNMGHDFLGSPGTKRTCVTDGSKCTGINSVMDYYQVSYQPISVFLNKNISKSIL